MGDVEKAYPAKSFGDLYPSRSKEEIAESARHLVLAKLVYFFVFAADASWEPFAAYFLSTRNINTGMIGILLTVMTISNAIVGQILTAIADHYNVHKSVALSSFALFVALTCSMYFSNDFWWTAVIGVLAQCAWGPVLPMLDNVTVQMVQGTNEDYSKQRLWAAISWAVFCLGDGWVMERRGPNSILEVMGFAGLIALGLMWHYPFDKYSSKALGAERRRQEEAEQAAAAAFTTTAASNPNDGEGDASAASPVMPTTATPAADVEEEWCGFLNAPCRLISSNPLMLPFLSIIMCIGYLFGTIDGYLALWVVELGGSSGLVGAMYALASLVEIPLFFHSDKVYRWAGMRAILFISCGAYLVRVVSYSMLQDPFMVLFVEPFHALTIALFWGPCVTYMNDVLLCHTPELKATGQGSFFASFYTGRSIGYSLAGWLSDIGGMRFMFKTTLIAVGVLIVLVANFWRIEHILIRRTLAHSRSMLDFSFGADSSSSDSNDETSTLLGKKSNKAQHAHPVPRQ